MTMHGNYLMDQIKQAQTAVKDKAIKNWDMVTMPIDPANPDVSPDVSFHQIFAISAQSAQAKAAWTFLQYVTSDEYARVASNRQQGNMPVRPKYLKDPDGHHLEAFYSLKPSQPKMYADFQKMPQDFFMNFSNLGAQELKSVADGQKTVSEVLAILQTKGQEALMAAKKKQDAAPKAGSNASSSGSSQDATVTTNG